MTGRIKFVAVLAVATATLASITGGAGAASSSNASKSVARNAASTAAARRAVFLHHADFSTIAGARAYLRAIGVNPRGVVIQRGARNYAGPNCPGTGWTCTETTHPVVQVAGGGKNTFMCTTRRCAVVQATAGQTLGTGTSLTAAAATNTAKCIRTSSLTQSCSINQSGTSSNVAIVREAVSKIGLTQTATFTAQITQQTTGAQATNTACVSQSLVLNGPATKATPIAVTLEAHQSITITQDSASGGNTVENATAPASCDASNPLTQIQTLTSSDSGAGSITQNENAVDNGPNVMLDIEQNQTPGFFGTASGLNKASFSQASNLLAIATTRTGPVTQTQSSTTGGIQANVNQDSRDVSTASANQTETQCEDALASGTPSCTALDPPAYSLTQTQFGPIGHTGGLGPSGRRTLMKVSKGTCPPNCATQTGNAGDTFTISQTTTQNNDTGQNQTNAVLGDCTTPGNCTVTQNATVDGQTTTNTQSGQAVNTQTTCTGSSCTASGPTSTPVLTFLTNGLSVTNADVAESGFGGMRNVGVNGPTGSTGTGTINVSGVSGPVFHAFLYWNGPTNSTDPNSNATVTFNGQSVTGTNIGTASDNCWGFTNSQSYRADVTSFVTGNGSYSLSNFVKPDANSPNGTLADINGVALIVFYNDANSANDRNVVIWNGNDSNVAFGTDPQGWDETITGVPYPGSGSASLDFVVSDGQSFADDALVLNGLTLAPAGSVFDGNSTPAGPFEANGGNLAGVTGSLWDVKSFDITSFLSQGSNNLHVTTGLASDCLSLVAMAANVPANAQPVVAGATRAAPTMAKPAATPSSHAVKRGGGVN
jgi:hypothetical protein